MTTKIEYLNHTISLDHDYRFQVTGPLFEHAATFDTYKQAQEQIAMRKQVATKEGIPELKLEVIPGNYPDRTVIIDGIHGTTQHLQLKPRLKDSEEPTSVYPVAPFVRDLLKKRQQLRREVAAIDMALEPMSIGTRRGYGRIIGVSKLIEMVNLLKKEHEDACKHAYDEQEKLNQTVSKEARK
jgi:hypothetical protein